MAYTTTTTTTTCFTYFYSFTDVFETKQTTQNMRCLWSCTSPVTKQLCVLCRVSALSFSSDPGAVPSVGGGPRHPVLLAGPPPPRVPVQELLRHLQTQEGQQHRDAGLRLQEHDEGEIAPPPLAQDAVRGRLGMLHVERHTHTHTLTYEPVSVGTHYLG